MDDQAVDDVEHVGGWAHIEIWVKHPDDLDPPNHKSNPDHPLIDLVDVVGSAVYDWAKKYPRNYPTVHGSVNADPPDWARQ